MIKTNSLDKKKKFRINWACFFMVLPVVVWFLIFKYYPLYYIKDAFFQTKLNGDSVFIGLDYFKTFFEGGALRYIGNTVIMNILTLIFTFPAGIALAINFEYIRRKTLKKSLQIITYLPHFMSTAAMVALLYSFCDSTYGPFAQLFGDAYSISFMYRDDSFRTVYVIAGLWQTMGWNSIVHSAALTTIDPTLYEAGKIDGAGVWDEIFSITIPSIKTTIITMLIMRIGSMMSADFEKYYLMQNNFNINKSEVISTYVYKMAFTYGNFGVSVAAGLFNSVVALILVGGANFISKRLAEVEFM